MVRFQDHSITTKLTRMNILVSGAALLLACGAFIAYDLITFREVMVYNLSIQAQIAGSNSVSALAFNDPNSAETTLSALKASPNIVAAGILLPNGRPFAQYARAAHVLAPDLPSIPQEQIEVHKFGGGNVVLVRSIIFQGKPIGTVYLQSDLERVNARLRQYVWIAATVLAVSLLLAFAISAAFRRAIAEPIESLAEVARIVSREKNYSVRATPTGNRDELAMLIRAFNEMLEQIQERDQALRSAHDELDLRVQERTAQLAAANNELEAFSYSVSHDLRTPLRTIDGFSQALLEDFADKLDEQGKKNFERIRTATQRMGMLIDDLLKLSQVTRADLRKERFDFSALAESIAAELQLEHPERRASIHIEKGLETNADPRLMRVVLENLLNNAWKYTSKHSNAQIEIGKTQVNGDFAFYVRDDGAGFDPAYANRLFGAFQRLHSLSEFPGTGIGLATVHRILLRHGGHIWAESAVEKGATFYFTLGQNRLKEDHPQ